MSDKKNDGASKAPSEMTVRYYDAAEVERLEILHKRMGGSLNAFLKSLIQAGYERLAPVYLGRAARGSKDFRGRHRPQGGGHRRPRDGDGFAQEDRGPELQDPALGLLRDERGDADGPRDEADRRFGLHGQGAREVPR
jgi:hypothetical protein